MTSLKIQPIKGFEAFKLFLTTLQPKDGNKELWLKQGDSLIFVGDWNESGRFQIHHTRLENPADPNTRQRKDECHDAFEHLAKLSQKHNGGTFFIPSQPLGKPLATCVDSTDEIGIEMDSETTEFQLDKYQRFTAETGLRPCSLISSGGKSIHGHFKLDQHYPIDLAQYIRRLTVLAFVSDPVTVNLHQPMRLPGFYRKEKDSTQDLLFCENNRYTPDQFLEGLQAWFKHLDWAFPDAITDEWWSECFRPIIAPANNRTEQEKIDQIRDVLGGGLAGFEQKKALEQAERLRKQEQRQFQLSHRHGKPDWVALINEACEQLGPQAFDWEGHGFTFQGDHERAPCLWHQSSSGTAVWIGPLHSGKPGWGLACPTCTGNKQINGFTYWLWRRNGHNTPYPKGKDFIELAKEFLQEKGFPIPENANTTKPGGDKGLKRLSREDIDQPLTNEGDGQENQWHAPIERDGELGKWKTVKSKNGGEQTYFEALCDFTLKVTKEFEGKSGGGFEFQMKRKVDPSPKTVFIRSQEITKVDDFLDALKSRYGSFVSCKLTKNDLNALIWRLSSEYRAEGGKLFRLIDRRGRQEDGTWVFPNRQFKADGTLTTSEKTSWVYTSDFYESKDFIPEPDIDEYDPEALKRYLKAKQKFFGSNFPLSLMLDGFVVATLHDAAIMEQERFFPLVNAHGDSGSMKTLAAQCSVSLVGYIQPEGAILARASESLLYERLKYSGSLPIFLDDPSQDISSQIDEISKNLYNRFPRSVRGNTQKPHGSFGITSNWQLGENQNAAKTRIIHLFFGSVSDKDESFYQELQQANAQVNRCFPDLLKLGYPRQEIKALETELAKHLRGTHARTPLNLAIITYYALEVVKLGQIDFDLKSWVISTLIPQLKRIQTGLDFLSDFKEKFEVLHAESLVGDWNFRSSVTNKNHGECVALYLPGIWPALTTKYPNLAYNQGALEALLLEKGAVRNQTAKFMKDADFAKARNRNQAAGYSVPDDTSEQLQTSRKCFLVPKQVWDAIGCFPEEESLVSPSEGDSLPSGYPGYLRLPDEVTARNVLPVWDTDDKKEQVTKLPKNIDIKKDESKTEDNHTNNNIDFRSTSLSGNFGNLTEKSASIKVLEPLPAVTSQGNQKVTRGNQKVTSTSECLKKGQTVHTPYGLGKVLAVDNGLVTVEGRIGKPDYWHKRCDFHEITPVEEKDHVA